MSGPPAPDDGVPRQRSRSSAAASGKSPGTSPFATFGDEGPHSEEMLGGPVVEVYRFALPEGVRKSAFVVVPVIVLAIYGTAAILHPAILHSRRAIWAAETSWVAAFLALVIVHESCHAAVMWLAGARPRVGIRLRSLQPFALADGHRFRRGEWIALALAPLLVTAPLSGLLLALYPNQSWTLVLAIVALAGCSGDVDMVLRAARTSVKGDLIEDTRRGLLVLRPSGETPGVEKV